MRRPGYGASLLLLAAAAAARGQLYKEEKGPGLDPSPLVVPRAAPAAKRPITSLDLLSIRDVTGASISPDGKRIAYVLGQAVLESNAYRTALFVVGTEPGSVPRHLGDVGPPFWKLGGQWFPEPPRWSPDSRSIALRMKRGPLWQVWRWNPDGGEPAALTRSPRDVQSFRWSEDGSRIVYQLYRVPDPALLARMQTEGVLYDQDFQGAWDTGTPVTEQKTMEEPPPETWLHELAGGADRPASAEEAARDSVWVRTQADLEIAEASWSPDHRRLAYNRYIDDPSRCRLSCYPLFVRDADGGNERLLTPGVYYAGNPQWSADGTRIYFERRDEDGRGATLMAVSPDGGAPTVLLRSDDHLSDCSWDARKERAVCLVESHVTAPRPALVDVRSGTLRVVADPNPELAAFALTAGTRLDWDNGKQMVAYLVKPRGFQPGKRYPLIVTTYRSGTGFLRGAVGDEYPIPVFAAHGFAVLVFDSGADTNTEPGDFEGSLAIWEAPLEGLRRAIGMAVEMGVADPDRVGYTGLSHGSEIGAYAISHSDLFRAASMSGAGSWDPFFADLASPFMRPYLQRWGLTDAAGKPLLDRFGRLSATLNAGRITTPLLINAPDNEYLISLPLHAAMRAAKKPVELWVYPDEYHTKNQPRHRYSVYERNLDWFRFWLKGEEDPSSAKTDQYGRWRKLRALDEENRAAAPKGDAIR